MLLRGLAARNNPINNGDIAITRRIVVTGANGFVGRHLCDQLAFRGVLIRAAVRATKVVLPDAVEIVEGCDLESDNRWPEALSGVDCVIHCAARVHVMDDTESDPLDAFRRANVDGALRVARMAARAGSRRFIFLSSVKVLGESTSGREPFKEADVPSPQDPYAQSKWEAEQALRKFGAETGMEVVIVRCPLVYGSGVGGNFRSLIRIADSPWPLPLGNIDNARSLIFVGNLIDFLIRAMDSENSVGQTFLVSDGEDVSTTQLIRSMRNELGRAERLFGLPWRLLSPLVRWTGRGAVMSRLLGSLQVDISRAQHQLGWQPPYSVSQGLTRTFESDAGYH